MVALKGVKDVRDVVKTYDDEDDIPRAFKRRMRSIAQAKASPQQGRAIGGRSLLPSFGGK